MKCNVNLTGWALVLLTVALAASCEAIRPAGGMTPAQGHIESLARTAQVDADYRMMARVRGEAKRRATNE
jgi:hypothetical protein